MSKSDYPSDWDQRRKNVYSRDGYECRACGISPKETHEVVELHAHHIKPISEGGGHELENLITLCKDCHMTTHSENDSPPFEPVTYQECKGCDSVFATEGWYAPGYCSESCFVRFRADKVLKQLHTDEDVCSKCYTQLRGENVCPECGNFENAKKVDHDGVEMSYQQIRNLVALSIWWREM